MALLPVFVTVFVMVAATAAVVESETAAAELWNEVAVCLEDVFVWR